MAQQIILLIMLALGFSCFSDRQANQVEQHIASHNMAQPIFAAIDKERYQVNEKIRFDFTAVRVKTFRGAIEIRVSLYNDNTDTVYFLSSSCWGEQYSLCYDTTKFVLTPLLYCNASYPRLMKIAPKGQYQFQTYFSDNNTETKIKLGFDFYSVHKAFDFHRIALAAIHNRQEREQTIVWASEKLIK
jgi:hypothetical protein